MSHKIYLPLKISFLFLLLYVIPMGKSLAQEQHKNSNKKQKKHLKPPRKRAHLGDSINLPFNYKVSRREYAGAISSISGEEMARFRVPNNSNMLAGRVAGLSTSMGSYEPGFDGSTLSIWGTNSYNGYSPTIYVDNAQSIAFAQLDPLEIDQFVVLKDAVANASYGIHGANKAISVTTRRGVPFQNKINFYSQVGILTPAAKPPFLGAKEYMILYNEAGMNDGTAPFYPQASIDQYDNPHRDKVKYPDVDWFNELVSKTAVQQKYDLTFSGGNEDVRYFVLLGYMEQQGFLKYGHLNESSLGFVTNSGYSRYNLRSNLDFKVSPSLTASLDLGGRLEIKNLPAPGTSPIFANIGTYPPGLFPILYPDGKIGGYNQGGLNYTRNPYGLITHTGYIKQSLRSLFVTARVVQKLDKLIKGLSATANFSAYNYNYTTDQGSMDFASYYLQPDGTYAKYGNDVPYTAAAPAQDQDRTNTFWAKIDYQHKFNSAHEVTANIGFSQSVRTPSGDDFPYATQGFFGNAHYAYKKKYIAELTMGYNGSENLQKGKRYGFFPALAAAWLISEENFIKSKELNLLKVRASFGLLGNSSFAIGGTGTNRYLYTSAYGTGNPYVFGQNPVSNAGRSEGALANPNVTWETSTTANFGIDAAFFSNKVAATINLFTEQRYDILATPATVSSLIGGVVKPRNVGKVNNKGIDWDVSYTHALGEFSFSLHAIGSYARNKILFEDEVVRPYPYLYQTGRPVGTSFGLKALGFFKDQAEINASPVQTFSPVRPGDIKYKDQNGDGRIDQYDQVALGKPVNSPFYYGGQLELKFKNMDLNLWFQGTGDRTISVLNGATFGFANGAKPTTYVLNRWTPATAATADYPELSLKAKNSDNNYQNSDFWLKNGKYLRLKNVELGYNFSPSFLKSLHLSKARFYLSCNNVFTWTKLKADYLDPEYPNAGVGNYPIIRSFHTGLNIEF